MGIENFTPTGGGPVLVGNNAFFGSNTFTGVSDVTQLTIKGNSTQTSDIFKITKSDNTSLFSVDNSGNVTFSGTMIGTILSRTGTAASIASIVLGLGEAAFTTDTKKLFYGDGSTTGGNQIGDAVRSASNTFTGAFTVLPLSAGVGSGTAVSISGGATTANSQFGGSVTIHGGNNTASVPGGGGDVNITGGNVPNTGFPAGVAYLDCGSGGSTAGAKVNIGTVNAATITLGGTNTTEVRVLGRSGGSTATASYVGEVISSTIATGSAVSLSTGTTANVTSISLTKGNWLVWGTVYYNQGASTTATAYNAGISSTTATLGANDGSTNNFAGTGVVVTTSPTLGILPVVVKITTTTTYYLVTQSTFAVSTMTAYGAIFAERFN